MSLELSGKVVYVHSEKTEKGRHYKKLQILCNGGAGRAALYDVTDMGNSTWAMGAEVRLPVSLQVYQGKNGLGYNFTHWGVDPESAPPPSDPGAGKGKVFV